MKLKLICNNLLKTYYFLIFTIVYCCFLWWLFPFTEKQIGIIASSTGVYLSIIYFFQKQNLEELRLFKELFVEFNARYDQLNNKLNNIDSEKNDNDILDDYFNLCAEEYLFYKKGIIITEVWQSWCNGMKSHLEKERILTYWKKAQKDNSYYGLDIKIITNDLKKR